MKLNLDPIWHAPSDSSIACAIRIIMHPGRRGFSLMISTAATWQLAEHVSCWYGMPRRLVFIGRMIQQSKAENKTFGLLHFTKLKTSTCIRHTVTAVTRWFESHDFQLGFHWASSTLLLRLCRGTGAVASTGAGQTCQLQLKQLLNAHGTSCWAACLIEFLQTPLDTPKSRRWPLFAFC